MLLNPYRFGLPPSALLTGLVSYWKLDESSGNALDSHGTNHLTDINTVGSAPGKIGNARDFEKDNVEYFTIPSNASLQTGDIAFTLSVWFQMESNPSPFLISRDSSATAEREYMLTHTSTLDFYVFNPAGGFHNVSNAGALSIGVWHFAVCWHDPAADKIYLQVNNGLVYETVHTGGAKPSTAPFRIGARDHSSPFPMDGLIDEVGFWKRMLTPAERTALYNAGNGLAYPFT